MGWLLKARRDHRSVLNARTQSDDDERAVVTVECCEADDGQKLKNETKEQRESNRATSRNLEDFTDRIKSSASAQSFLSARTICLSVPPKDHTQTFAPSERSSLEIRKEDDRDMRMDSRDCIRQKTRLF
jgi:hypothetical protein